MVNNLDKDNRNIIVNTAQRKRRSMEVNNKEDERILQEGRIKKMECEKKKAAQKEERRIIEIEMLSAVPVIHTEIEPTSALQNIEADKTNTIPGKEKMKLELLKNHIRIRNKISSSSRISLTFSYSILAVGGGPFSEPYLRKLPELGRSSDTFKEESLHRIQILSLRRVLPCIRDNTGNIALKREAV